MTTTTTTATITTETTQGKSVYIWQVGFSWVSPWVTVSMYLGLIISGGNVGNSVEVFVPSTGHHCLLPDTQWQHRQHSMEKNVICGGHHPAWKYCLTLTNGTWEFTTTLLEQRFRHSSWASPSGMILLGGLFSRRTTEKIGEDGTSSYSFELKYNTS